MRTLVGGRLPQFTDEQKQLIKGYCHFFFFFSSVLYIFYILKLCLQALGTILAWTITRAGTVPTILCRTPLMVGAAIRWWPHLLTEMVFHCFLLFPFNTLSSLLHLFPFYFSPHPSSYISARIRNPDWSPSSIELVVRRAVGYQQNGALGGFPIWKSSNHHHRKWYYLNLLSLSPSHLLPVFIYPF